MKYILPTLLLLLAMISCKRESNVKPVTPIDTDAFVHHISFVAPVQYSAGNASSSTLTLIYYENVNILVPKQGYELSYALHLKEDFSSSVLKNFQYTTVDKEGDVTVNWVDDNLNNISGKTVKDTTVNGMAMVNVNVQRPFTFTKTYADSKTAAAELDSITRIQTDKVNFSSYLYFTKTYPASVTSSSILYAK